MFMSDIRRFCQTPMRFAPTPRARFLFAPGNDERKLTRASSRVPTPSSATSRTPCPTPKRTRRARVTVDVLAGADGTTTLRLVRVNGAGTPWIADDIAALAAIELDAVVLPKATPAARRRGDSARRPP